MESVLHSIAERMHFSFSDNIININELIKTHSHTNACIIVPSISSLMLQKILITNFYGIGQHNES